MLSELAERWTSAADALERWGDERGAAILRRCIVELEAHARERADEDLTLAEAARESGYSKRRLRELIAEGTIPQAGRKGAPRIRRRDLPRKPSADVPRPSGYDVSADAASLAGRIG